MRADRIKKNNCLHYTNSGMIPQEENALYGRPHMAAHPVRLARPCRPGIAEPARIRAPGRNGLPASALSFQQGSFMKQK
jgi:hypothetical protein